MQGVAVRVNRIAKLNPCIETEIHLYKWNIYTIT